MEVEGGDICGGEIKWKPVSEILSDSSLNVGNANETMEMIQILYYNYFRSGIFQTGGEEGI